MVDLAGKNMCVLDLESLHSADDCRHCGQIEALHSVVPHRLMLQKLASEMPQPCASYERIGWENYGALGLSIGCYFDYQDMALHWFDAHTLGKVIETFIDDAPLLVSFNGIQFDFPLMQALQCHHPDPFITAIMQQVCEEFEALYTTSYDLLNEIWRRDPDRKLERGLSSLDALCRANGLPAKEMDGATAPRLWQQGRYAEVIQYCQNDVLRTKALFEMVCEGKPLLRGDGQPILLPRPTLPREDD